MIAMGLLGGKNGKWLLNELEVSFRGDESSG